MIAAIVIGVLAFAATLAVVWFNTGYARGQEESSDRWIAYLSEKEDEMARLQRELKDALAAMRMLQERKDGDNGKA